MHFAGTLIEAGISQKKNMQLQRMGLEIPYCIEIRVDFDQLGLMQYFYGSPHTAHNILCPGDTGTFKLKQDFLVSTCYLCVKYLIFGILCIGFRKSINYNVSFCQIEIQHPPGDTYIYIKAF